MKYIRTIDNEVIIFSNSFTHSEIASKLRVKAKSAGFILINQTGELVPYGGSHTLELKSLEEDKERINNQL